MNALQEIVEYINNLGNKKEVKVNKEILGKIKFDVKLEEYTDDEVDEIFEESGINIETSKYIERKNLKKSNRKYLLKFKKS